MDFTLPQLGEGVYEADLIRWLVTSGTVVRAGTPIAEVMTDKATTEVPAPFFGRIVELLAEPNSKVRIGQILLRYEPLGEFAPVVDTASAAATAASAPATAASFPTASALAAGDSASFPTASALAQGASTAVPAGAGAVSVPTVSGAVPTTAMLAGATSPASMPIAGTTSRSPGSAGAGLHGNGSSSKTSVPRPASSAMPPAAAPSVRHLARKLGIDLAQVHGSGPGGRILLDDLAQYLQQQRPIGPPPTTTAEASTDRLDIDLGKPGTRVKLAGLRKKVADHMTHCRNTVPQYTYIDECEITDLVKLRSSLKEPFRRRGIKLTYLAFFVKAVAGALKEVPLANASLDEAAGEIVLHDRYHIGIAVAVSGGLIVPVIRDVDQKDLPTIARDIERLSQEARAGRVKLEDLRGGTFTVTSVGSLGGMMATPVVNHPEVGILGLGKVSKRPMYDDRGRIYPADMIFLSLSFDHRVVDGAVAAIFANALIRRMQNPATLLLPADWQ